LVTKLRANDLEFHSHYLAHQLGRKLSEIDEMGLDEYYAWLDYFSILNGTKPEEPKSEEENNSDLISFLRSKKE